MQNTKYRQNVRLIFVIDEIIDSWQIANRINLYLLDSIEVDDLAIKNSQGRNIAEQFAHIHNVRLMWLKSAAPELMQHLNKLESDLSKETLSQNLNDSAQVIAKLLETNEKIKGFKPHKTAFFAYLVAHEAHHRGQIMLALKQAGKLDRKISFGLWEWGTR